jgi:hypothetical protein
MRYFNKENITAIVIALVTSAVFAIISVYFTKYVMPDPDAWLSRSTVISIPNSYLLPAVVFLVFLVGILCVFFLRLFIPFRSVSGREEAMAGNLSTLERFYSKDKVFWSTRLTFWSMSENSVARVAFRDFITRAVQDKTQVRRVWHIKSRADFDRLCYYLGNYRNFENYHVKAIFGDEAFLSEIAGIGTSVGMISLPALENPASIVKSIQFYRHRDVRTIKEYFDLIWERALAIKISERIYSENLAMLEKFLDAT